ncbi:hypothetical protein Ciccas_004916 [Cichlidogyrus casuarinus]|uniref:Uncharacterized protein n=1 Tax=Cichlidogyrus casuarinus TaxID=1844966 RepID=A0ABD2QA76_9PLAT
MEDTVGVFSMDCVLPVELTTGGEDNCVVGKVKGKRLIYLLERQPSLVCSFHVRKPAREVNFRWLQKYKSIPVFQPATAAISLKQAENTRHVPADSTVPDLVDFYVPVCNSKTLFVDHQPPSMSTVKPSSPPQSLVLMKQDCESQQSLLGPPKLQPMVERRESIKAEPLTPAAQVFDYPSYEFCVTGEDLVPPPLSLQSNGRAIKRHHSPPMAAADHSSHHQHQRVTSSQSSAGMSVPYQPSAMSFYEDLHSFKQNNRSSLSHSMTSTPAGMERHRSSEAAADMGPFTHRTMQPRNSSSIYFESSIAPASSSTSPSVDAPASVSAPGFTTPESAFYQYQNRMEAQLCQVSFSQKFLQPDQIQ